MKTKIIITGIILFSYLTVAQAQVTIGSAVPPKWGNLLSIKESGNRGQNSHKGLGLPRVTLTSLTTLTVDDDSQGNDYVGMIVYNVHDQINRELPEGTYCWFGDTWRQVILIDDAGSEGNLLRSNGDYTYSWTNITVPQYDFWKPTQTAVFESSKSTRKTYTYEDITRNRHEENNTVYYSPDTSLFDGDFAYSDKLNIQTNVPSGKYLIVDLTANIGKRTRAGYPAVNSFWENMQIDIYVDGSIVKTYRRSCSTTANAMTNTTLNLFSTVSLTNFYLNKGEYDIRVKISNISNIYPFNGGTSNGNFATSGDLVDIEVTNFGFILYEQE